MKRIILLCLSVAFLTTTYAQDKVQSYSVSGGLLGAVNMTKFRIPDNDAETIDYDSKAGWSLGGWVNFPVGTGFSIEPQIMYSKYRYHTNSTVANLLLSDGKIGYVQIPLLLKLHAGEKFAFTFGPQLDILTSVDDDDNIATDGNFNKTSFSIHGGIEVFPRGKVTLFGRFVHGLSDMDDRSNHPAGVEFKNQAIQLGVKLRLFGGTKETKFQAAPEPVILDRDGDGINDDVDRCPDVVGLAKYNGCPIPDTDGDGINDEEDKCPNEKGIAKYNGCPIPDSDGDGINDEEDKCPNQAGVAKYNGCPVPDKDNDGINDDEDKCPDIAGVASNNGCPEVPANVSKTIGLAAGNIKFGASNAKLTTASNASLNQIVAVMNDNPGLNVRIEGHTSNVGDDAANMKLSQDRADAVKAYLVSKGIAESRITAEGFGETMPVADNATSAGRTKNNRVEVRVAY